MSMLPTGPDTGKHCFSYCGDDVCDCEMAPRYQPQPPAEQYPGDAYRDALISRILYVADLCDATPLRGDLGDVAYDLLRSAAAQISSDRQRLARLRSGESGD